MIQHITDALSLRDDMVSEGHGGGHRMQGMISCEKNTTYVLVIDAISNDSFSTCILLQRLGYYTITANTAEEAVEFMNVARPSVIVADDNLPGTALLSGVRKDPRFSHIPFIFLSSSQPTQVDDWKGVGRVAAFLRKPVNVAELYRALQSIIEKGSRRNIRVSTQLTATVIDANVGGEGYVTALSEDGMFFQGIRSQPLMTRIPISFELNGRVILLEAIVLYNTMVEESRLKKFGMGMKFEKISPVDRDLIKAFILDQIKEGLSRQKYYTC